MPLPAVRTVPIERVHRPTPEEFRERFLSAHRPVIMTGMLDGYPVREWTPESLAERHGHAPVPVVKWAGGGNTPHEYIDRKEHLVMPLREYVAKLRTELDGSRELYGEQMPIFQIIPELRGEIPVFDPYYHLPRVPPRYQRRFMWAENMWLGPRGTVTVLHCDPVENLLCQVYGRKTVTLFPQEEHDNLYADDYLPNQPYHYSPIDVEAPDLAKYPKYKSAIAHHDVLAPGEVLYLPFAWWHWVRAEDVSISLNFFWMRLRDYAQYLPLTMDAMRRQLMFKIGLVDPRLG